jgi:PAS domain S-box-containing protein
MDLSTLSLAIAEHAPWPMAIVEGSSHVVRYVNAAFCRLKDNPTQQLVGKPFCDMLPEKDGCVALLDQVYRTGKPETHTEQQSSTPHPVFWSYTMWPVLADTLPVGVMIQVTETTQFHENTVAMNEALTLGSVRQHELTEAAESLNAQLRVEITARETSTRELAERARLLDLSLDAIIVRDLSDHIRWWNKGAEKLYGWTDQEVSGKNLHSLLQTEFPKPLEEIVAQLHSEGQFSGEVVQIARDGRRIPSLCHWVLDFGTESILASYTDITARKAVEAEMAAARDRAIQASHAKDDFLAALSHELRTPLSPVLLMASEAANDATLPDQARETFAMIVKNVKLEARLIDDLLDVTRITHGKLALDLQDVDVHVPLQDAIETVRSELEGKQITLKLNLARESPVMFGDPVRLQQIFWNVLRNAVKFSLVGGEIMVETAILPGGTLSIRVSDAGMGITKQELGRLFTSFSQGDHASATGSHRFGGLGLGLSISRMLAEMHSGTIRAESPGANQGSVFIIEFPLVRIATRHEPVSPVVLDNPSAPVAAPPTRDLLPARILLVDDHVPTRKALTQLLVRRHYEVVPVGSLTEARAVAEGSHFDFLISDIGLPDGTGNELMAELKARFGLIGIALTGYGRDEDLARSHEAGFLVHLTKPVSVQSLELALIAVEAASDR